MCKLYLVMYRNLGLHKYNLYTSIYYVTNIVLVTRLVFYLLCHFKLFIRIYKI